MAIYHFSAKIISRANGSSALASAAYRSASRLHDQRLDRHHDFSNKTGVVHSEVILPDGAPEHLGDRGRLWNAVEAAEKRIDAQLAREIEFAIPREIARQFHRGGIAGSLGAHPTGIGFLSLPIPVQPNDAKADTRPRGNGR